MAVVIKAMVSKQKLACNCFGSTTNEMIGWRTVVKIVLLSSSVCFLLQLSEHAALTELTLLELTSAFALPAGSLILYTLWTNVGLIGGKRSDRSSI
ncbi:hypothetical protein D3C84_1073390 [compost metagenome]